VGDAVSVFDPLSSTGVLKALKSGREAAVAAKDYLCGNASAMSQYSEKRLDEFRTYLRHRERQYGIESRWLGEKFWARRGA
jgi:flavin-dependent dehydrogenase